MPKTFKIGGHVRWNSEAGRVSGIIIKKITSDIEFKGYVHHASRLPTRKEVQQNHWDDEAEETMTKRSTESARQC